MCIRDSYEGELAKAIDADSKKHHGFLRYEDLAAHEVLWQEPLHVHYHDHDIWDLPPKDVYKRQIIMCPMSL